MAVRARAKRYRSIISYYSRVLFSLYSKEIVCVCPGSYKKKNLSSSRSLFRIVGKSYLFTPSVCMYITVHRPRCQIMDGLLSCFVRRKGIVVCGYCPRSLISFATRSMLVAAIRKQNEKQAWQMHNPCKGKTWFAVNLDPTFCRTKLLDLFDLPRMIKLYYRPICL